MFRYLKRCRKRQREIERKKKDGNSKRHKIRDNYICMERK
jgi:hypothetical protein